jgi:LacI family transcriptional regulator
MEITSKIRIKDIAERAGVSVGTVDRIIHGRGNVSPISMERVQKVLDEAERVRNIERRQQAYRILTQKGES